MTLILRACVELDNQLFWVMWTNEIGVNVLKNHFSNPIVTKRISFSLDISLEGWLDYLQYGQILFNSHSSMLDTDGFLIRDIKNNFRESTMELP